jgi:hypothetical protein
MPKIAAFSPLTSLQLFPARLMEVLLFAQGELKPEKYPEWVRKIGRDLIPYLPPRIVAACKKDAGEALSGALCGMLFAALDTPKLIELDAEDVHWFSRSLKTVDHPEALKVDVTKIRQQLQGVDPKATVASALAAKTTLPAASRQAFFEGFACGLDVEKQFATLGKGKSAERVLLRLYLWLRWPEIVECGSIPAAYKKCRAAFAKTGGTHLLGSEAAFKKFCNRYRISFRTQQAARRRSATATI